ncbi:MAG TPA: TetR/AcrR family transcriptional regulator [Planctomycetota bacterium]|jgi:AcrR family transcriptional regulator|nr:TetR/AcrR family transcriptional regulator [Planctomycetota bacterium]
MARPPKAREPLKQAALELFVERSVHGTGIREIAKHAGCSEAALYRHWANKEALVTALFQEHMGDVRELLESAITKETTLEAKVRGACRAAYKLYDEHPQVFRFVLLVQHELAKSIPPDLRMPQDVVTDLVRDAAAKNEIPKPAKGEEFLLAAAVIGIFLETAIFVLYNRVPGPLSRYVEPVTQSAMRVLRAK